MGGDVRHAEVWVNGLPRTVPGFVLTYGYMRLVLGVPDGHVVLYKGPDGWTLIGLDEKYRWPDGVERWDFSDGEQYMHMPRGAAVGGLDLRQRLKRVEDEAREEWQTDPDAWKDGYE